MHQDNARHEEFPSSSAADTVTGEVKIRQLRLHSMRYMQRLGQGRAQSKLGLIRPSSSSHDSRQMHGLLRLHHYLRAKLFVPSRINAQ